MSVKLVVSMWLLCRRIISLLTSQARRKQNEIGQALIAVQNNFIIIKLIIKLIGYSYGHLVL